MWLSWRKHGAISRAKRVDETLASMELDFMALSAELRSMNARPHIARNTAPLGDRWPRDAAKMSNYCGRFSRLRDRPQPSTDHREGLGDIKTVVSNMPA